MTIEQYAENYSKLHPKIRTVFQSYFDIDLNSVKVRMIDKTTLFRNTIFVVADTIVIVRGKFNFEFKQEPFEKDGKLWHRVNGAVDLSTDTGLQTLGHEIKHCEQWRLTPRWKYWLLYLPGVINGYIKKKQYAHKFIWWEREAIAFQKTLKFSEQEKQLFKEMQKN